METTPLSQNKRLLKKLLKQKLNFYGFLSNYLTHYLKEYNNEEFRITVTISEKISKEITVRQCENSSLDTLYIQDFDSSENSEFGNNSFNFPRRK